MTLLIAVFLPLAVATIIGRIPARYLQQAGLLTTGLDLLVSLVVLQAAARGAPLSLNVDWAGQAGLGLRLSADGVSASLLTLNALVGLMAVLATRVDEIKRPHLFLAMLLAVQTAVAGALLARDLVLFFVFYEAVLVPFFILIAIFGEGRAQYTALKLLIFTSAGSLAMLVSILAVTVASGGAGSSSFAFDRLTQVRFDSGAASSGWVLPTWPSWVSPLPSRSRRRCSRSTAGWPRPTRRRPRRWSCSSPGSSPSSALTASSESPCPFCRRRRRGSAPC